MMRQRQDLERAGVGVERVGIDEAQRHDHQRPGAGDLADRLHRAVAGQQCRHVGAHGARGDGGDHVAEVDAGEHPAGLHVAGQVARVVRDERAEAEHVDDQQRHPGDEQAERRGRQALLAVRQRPERQRLDEHDHDRDADEHGRHLGRAVHPPVPVDADHHRGHREDQDPGRDRDPGDDEVQRLGLDDELRRDEPEVQQEHGEEQERRAVEAELAAALDHLRHAQLGALGRVQRDQQRADAGAHRDRDQRPVEAQPEADHHAAEHDVEDVRVSAQPQRELVPHPAVPLAVRDDVDVVLFDVQQRCRALVH
jgi:hypothetical protein